MDIDDLANGYFEESEVDFVGLWQIAQASREDLGARTTEEARTLSLEIVKRLYEKGLRPGDYYLERGLITGQTKGAKRSLIASNENGSRPTPIPILQSRFAGSRASGSNSPGAKITSSRLLS